MSLGWSKFISDADYFNQRYHTQSFAKAVCGRKLSQGEIGAALAHKRVYEELLRSKRAWAIVLEDDVEVYLDALDGELDNLKTFFEGKSGNGTVALLGYNSQTVLTGSSHSKFYKQHLIPSGAFGYAINHEAAKILCSEREIMLQADWPPSATKVSFYAVGKSWVTHDFTKPSRVDSSGLLTRSQLESRKYGVLRRLSYLRTPELARIFWHFALLRGMWISIVLPLSKSAMLVYWRIRSRIKPPR